MRYRNTIQELTLNNFRNHHCKKIIAGDGDVVITGYNGTGKTNILEAVSFLTAGRGLRKVKLGTINRQDGSVSHEWAVSALVDTARGEYKIGTGNLNSSDSNKRIIRIDDKTAKNQNELSEILNIIWLTPQMDRTFLDGNTARRKFFDRIVYSFDVEHASRVNKYEYYMRERIKLLTNRGDTIWIATIEQKMSEAAVAIAVARLETLERLQHVIEENDSAFPKAIMSIEGIIESIINDYSALQLEQIFADALRNNRDKDRNLGRTTEGVHRSILHVIHNEKNIAADLCSTGEQKILLLSIIIAQAKAVSLWHNYSPILLLDEVIAHLDTTKRQALFEEVNALQLQCWMTGTDAEMFARLGNFAHVEL
jgi:DNA replication and repair protein RecF